MTSSSPETRIRPRAAGDPAPLAAGDLVILTDRKGRQRLMTLDAQEVIHTHRGTLAHDDIIGQPEGLVLRTSQNMEYTIERPTRADYTRKMKRGAQVIYPKDQALIVGMADIRPGLTVIEGGLGSGALSTALLDAVGSDGTVISVERRDDHADIGRENVARLHGGEPDNWDVRIGDLADVLPTVSVHRIILDVLEPWLLIEGATQALAPGGIMLAYMPTITQVSTWVQALGAHGGFTTPEVAEHLRRTWNVDGLSVRPDHRMVAHTAFLGVTRKLGPTE